MRWRVAGTLVAIALVAACSSGADQAGPTTTTAVPTTSTAPPPSTVPVTTPPVATSAPVATTTTAPTVVATLPPLVAPLPWTEATSYTGVARMRLARDCTATLVDTGVDAGPAYLLSAGHCTEAALEEQNTVLLDRPTGGGARFLQFLDGPPANVATDASTVAFATMKGLDLAVVEVAGTLGELRAAGLRALPLAAAVPASGTMVSNPAIPVEALDPDDWLVRLGRCRLGEPVRVAEGRWTFDVVPNDCPGLRKGASGSPLVADGQIVAVVGTVAPLVADGRGCLVDHPCELRESGEVLVPGQGYAAPVARLAGCFGPDGRFSLALPGCDLPVGSGLQVVSLPPAAPPGTGEWVTEVRGAAGQPVLLKQGRALTTRCDDLAGYEPGTLPPDGRLQATRPVPGAPGVFVTCVVEAGAPLAQAATALLVVGPIGSPSS